MNIHHGVCLLTVFLCLPSVYCENARTADLFRRHCAALAQEAEKKNSMAAAGQDGWLFLAGELRHIGAGKFWGREAPSAARTAKPGAADPLPVILDFNEQLKKVGVKLIVVPVPPKAVIYPEMLPGFTNVNPAFRLDAVHQEFYALLRSNDVAVLDLTDFFLQKKNEPQCGETANEITAGRAPGPGVVSERNGMAAAPASSGQDGASPAKAPHEKLYCRRDSHWSGHGCVLAAGRIAEAARPFIGGNEKERAEFQNEWREIEISGDLRQALDNKNVLEGKKEKLRVRRIFTPGADEPVQPDRAGEIILLGDSHNLVFHAGDDMFCRGAGLPDQLAFEFSCAVDLIAVRGSGATPARINLMRRARQNKDYWKSRKCVIWCFSAREFTESDGWRKAPIE